MLPATPASLAALPRITDLSALQEADILFCSGNDIGSQIIEKATSSPWSHVGMLTKDPRDGNWYVIQATEDTGVGDVPLSFYTGNYEFSGKPYPGRLVVGRVTGLNLGQAASARNYGLSQKGAEYNKGEIPNIGIHLVLHLPPITPSKGEWICSQLDQGELDAAGIPTPDNSRGFFAPNDLWIDPLVTAVGILL